VALLLADLGITKTHSRPYTSDDNPFSEAQFKTLKYRPDFPKRFGSLDEARAFCQRFFTWYNGEHRHAGIGLMPPVAVHEGRADLMQTARHQVLMTAYAAHPERFVNKPPHPPVLPQAVWINPPTKESTAQNGVGTTIAIADDPRVAQHSEEIGVVAEIGGVTPYAITDPTDEVLH
jgi:putative transposase